MSKKIFVCKSCPQKFITPWRLLKHAQSDHAIQIYLENAQSEFHELSISDSGWQKDDSDESNKQEEKTSEANNQYVIEIKNENKEQNKGNSPDEDSGDDLYIADINILNNKDNKEDDQQEESQKGEEEGEEEEEHGKDDEDDEEDVCCTNQDCGVTVMPGTHENLKKCCSSIIPKKRKRHMEIKHMMAKGKKRVESSQSRTIYIDFEPTDEMTGSVQASVSEQDADTPQMSPTANTNTSTEQSNPLGFTSHGTFVLQPGSTYSIPMSKSLPQSLVSEASTSNFNLAPLTKLSEQTNSPVVTTSTVGSAMRSQPVSNEPVTSTIVPVCSAASEDSELVEAAETLSQLQNQATLMIPEGKDNYCTPCK